MKIRHLSRATHQLNNGKTTGGQLGPEVSPSEHAGMALVQLRRPELLRLVEAEMRKRERGREKERGHGREIEEERERGSKGKMSQWGGERV